MTRFITISLGVCIGGYVLLLIYAATPAYCHLTKSYADIAPCFKHELLHVDADTVMFGDSSLLYGINPSSVREVADVKSYNVGLVGPAFSFDPYAVMSGYLAQNKKPRRIVVYLAPVNRFQPGTITDPFWYPLFIRVAQSGSFGQMAMLTVARPSILVEAPPAVAKGLTHSSAFSSDVRSKMERADGHLDYAGLIRNSGVPIRRSSCARLPEEVQKAVRAAANAKAVEGLRQYGRDRGIDVLFYIAPTSVCPDQIGTIRNAYAGIADNVPSNLDPALFVQDSIDGVGVHLNERGVVVASHLLADFLIARDLSQATTR